MPTTKQQLAFLSAASELNVKYNAVRTGSQTLRLHLAFWTQSEIEHGQQMQTEWDVPTNLIPFYGDWHDLICLNIDNDSVQMIDDTRRELFTWPSHEAFLENLTTVEEEAADTSGIIESESWLDL